MLLYPGHTTPYGQQPDDGGNDQHCLQIWKGPLVTDGYWDDNYCSEKFNYFCEYQEKVTTTTMTTTMTTIMTTTITTTTTMTTTTTNTSIFLPSQQEKKGELYSINANKNNNKILL